MNQLKMYIAVLDQVPDHMVPVLVAHTVLGAHRTFTFIDNEGFLEYHDWLENSFKKVVVKVNQREFDNMSVQDNVYLGHENNTLGGTKSCVVFCPRNDWPRVVQFARLWQPACADAYAALLKSKNAVDKQLSDLMWERSPGQGMY